MIRRAGEVYKQHKYDVRNGLIHGVSVAEASGFIQWLVGLNDWTIPQGISTFLAAVILVPTIQLYLHKIDKKLQNGNYKQDEVEEEDNNA